MLIFVSVVECLIYIYRSRCPVECAVPLVKVRPVVRLALQEKLYLYNQHVCIYRRRRSRKCGSRSSTLTLVLEVLRSTTFIPVPRPVACTISESAMRALRGHGTRRNCSVVLDMAWARSQVRVFTLADLSMTRSEQ